MTDDLIERADAALEMMDLYVTQGRSIDRLTRDLIIAMRDRIETDATLINNLRDDCRAAIAARAGEKTDG